MASHKNFQVDRNKNKNITDIYNPDGNSFEKDTSEDRESRFKRNQENLLLYASFWRWYPDIFLDMVTPKGSTFKLFFYQRLFLRVAMRYRYVYATFTRAFSKSFLSVLTLYLKCIFFPGIKLFVCSGGKEQASNIAKEKILEIWEWFPVLKNEVRHSYFGKDYVELIFHNGSRFDIVAVRESTRGGRRHGGLVEESILVDGEKLSSVIIPLMNVDRRAKNGHVDLENENHKSQIYVTTAGYKNTFSYQKMIQLLVWMVTKGNAFVFGGDWRIPVLHSLLNPDFVEELKEDGTFNPLSFSREYESMWSGSSENAFFDADLITRNRLLDKPEFEPDKKKKNIFYIISADVARMTGKQNCDTVAMVFKCIPRKNGTFTKHIVNMKIFKGEHFMEQSIKIKKLAFHYNVRQVIVDGNGLGHGLVDFMVKENISDDTHEIFQPFSVTNDSDYDKFKTSDSLPLLYVVKANVGNASQMHVNVLSQISSGKVKFLIDEMQAKARLARDEDMKDIGSYEKAEYLHPFIVTSVLKEEMMNLQQEVEGNTIKLKQINKRIGKDKFSSLEYGLWYLKILEDKAIRRYDDVDASEFLMVKQPKLAY